MNICSTHSNLKKCLRYATLTEFWKLNGTCNISPESAEWRIGWPWNRLANAYLWRAGLLNVKEKGMTISYIMNRCLVMFLREGKVNVEQYRTSCPSTPTESTPESSPVKICSVKSLLVEKRLDCFTSLKILHNLFYPAKNTPSLIVPS